MNIFLIILGSLYFLNLVTFILEVYWLKIDTTFKEYFKEALFLLLIPGLYFFIIINVLFEFKKYRKGLKSEENKERKGE